MAAKQIMLRCKTKYGQETLDMLNGESTVSELKGILFSITGIDPAYMKILAGFPPKPLDLTNDNRKLDSLALQSGETLIVQEDRKAASELNQSNKRIIVGDTAMPAEIPPGILIRKVAPANNSCLFTSIHFAVSSGDYDLSCGPALRQIIADTVAADPTTYNEAYLGKPNKQYCTWILNEDHWGGAIETAILSKYYGLEIVTVDTQHVKLIHFGEGEDYDFRILLIYDGIHYDPLMLEPLDPSQQIQTIFPTSNEDILKMALDIAMEAKSSRQFTDVQNFTLRCLVCNVGLRGQEQARKHALETEHSNFGEI